LALVETRTPTRRHNAAAIGCFVTRTASERRSPVNHGGTNDRAGTTHVTEPGQVRSISSRLTAFGKHTRRSIDGSVAAITITPFLTLRLLSINSLETAR
jgi:hypothetical protein